MLKRLQEIEKRYEEIGSYLASGEALSDMEKYTRLAKEQADLEEIVSCYRSYKRTEEEMNAALEEAAKESGEMKELLLREHGFILRGLLHERVPAAAVRAAAQPARRLVAALAADEYGFGLRHLFFPQYSN